MTESERRSGRRHQRATDFFAGPLSQRYMLALAHAPLLSMEAPETVLVIAFGSHTTQLRRCIRDEAVDLRICLAISSRMRVLQDGNRRADDPRLTVHSTTAPSTADAAAGDLRPIPLEPPPIAYAGIGRSVSREFYACAIALAQAGYTPVAAAYQCRR